MESSVGSIRKFRLTESRTILNVESKNPSPKVHPGKIQRPSRQRLTAISPAGKKIGRLASSPCCARLSSRESQHAVCSPAATQTGELSRISVVSARASNSSRASHERREAASASRYSVAEPLAEQRKT